MTFTVQHEVADRLAAGCGSDAYGPVSVTAAIMGSLRPGPVVSPGAFWPRPNVESRMCRFDFDAGRAALLEDVGVLQRLLAHAFGQRRKQIRSISRRKGLGFPPDAVEASMASAGIDPSCRPQRVEPDGFLAFANALSRAV
jgi:16S rRNA (adenine1518-N6/adenine1519-N6)-dimethyltransferase